MYPGWHAEDALLSCLEKLRTRRPQTARELAHRLEQAPTREDWLLESYESWWDRHDRGIPPSMAASASAAAPGTVKEESRYDRTLVNDSGTEPPG